MGKQDGAHHAPRGSAGSGVLASFSRKAANRGANLVRGYAREEDGAVWIMTALLAVPLLIAVGVGLDTAELYRAKENFQQSADAAVLVAANMYSDGASEADSRAAGEKVFAANLVNLGQSTGKVTFDFPKDCGTGDIVAKVDGAHPLFFPAFHGVGKAANGGGAKIAVDSAASCPTTTFEVALVVDTSGSMGWRVQGDSNSKPKIETLRDSATLLVEDLFKAGKNVPRPNPVKFSIVPFSAMVNVGAANRSANWMDKKGKSPIHHQELNWSWDTGIRAKATDGGWRRNNGNGSWLTRFQLFDWVGEPWKGCVVARQYPHNTRDTAPDAGSPETLFLPAFAPDSPDDLWSKTAYEDDLSKPWCVRFQPRNGNTARKCVRWSDGRTGATNNAAYPRTPTYNFAGYYAKGKYLRKPVKDSGDKLWSEEVYNNDYIKDGTNMPIDNECRGTPQHKLCANKDNQWKRQLFTFKYRNPQWWRDDANVQNSNTLRSLHANASPNRNCTALPLLPLQTDEQTVKNYIEKLTANGTTNVAGGAVWGWRTLTEGAPFTEGRAKDVRDNRKIMILMTDGSHFYGNHLSGIPGSLQPYAADFNKSGYGGYGYGRHHDGVNNTTLGDGFMFDSFDKYANPSHNGDTWSEAMDNLLTQTCENAKKDGLTIYSIAFDVPNGSNIKKILEGCATPATEGGQIFYYDAKDSAKLTAAFEAIAKSIKRLKLTK